MLEGWTDARVHGRPLDPGPARAHGRRRPLPAARACGSRRRRPSTCCPGGRAWLGIGAAWNEEESRALGFPFPPLGERFEHARGHAAGWPTGCGRASAAPRRPSRAAGSPPARLLNSPQSISRPRVPIMIGGGGEKKTLRLVAQYGDACNVFGSPEMIARKYRDPRRALRGRRARPGRDRALDAAERRTSHRRAGGAARARPRSSTASATSPTPAPSTSSSASRASTTRPASPRSPR